MAAPLPERNFQAMSNHLLRVTIVTTRHDNQGTGPCTASRRGRKEQLEAASAIACHAAQRVRSEETQRKRFDALTTLLGVLATCMAAAAAITVVTDDISPSLTAACAFGSALASSLTARLHPAQLARQLRAESIRWVGVFDEAKHLERLLRSDSEGLSFEQVERELHTLENHRNDALRSAVAGESLWVVSAADGRKRCPAPDTKASQPALRIHATSNSGAASPGET